MLEDEDYHAMIEDAENEDARDCGLIVNTYDTETDDTIKLIERVSTSSI